MNTNLHTIRNHFIAVLSLSAALALHDAAYAQVPPPDFIWHVDDDAPGGIGDDWDSAFNNLQDALDEADESIGSDLIKVAQGTYKPSVPHCLGCAPEDITDRHNTFLVDFVEVTIKGGYAGVTADPGHEDDNDVDLYETILSGEIGDQVIGDNAYHVVTIRDTGTNETVIFRGLSVTAGNANVDPGVLDCSTPLGKSAGGGMLISAGTPAVSHCKFTFNSAFGFGGGLQIVGTNPLPEQPT
ncbi:MAG: hypothetical protein IH988_06535, partial [Planctomycetes bacterium]|nr:hypothetical protein [Planctomycetota bacterium]